MADALLTPNIIKRLQDKIYDKRKNAALELERTTKHYLSQKEDDKVHTIIQFVQTQLLRNSNPNSRKGGLIALAAITMAICQLRQDIQPFIAAIVPPVLAAFEDPDARVRYFACEAMYNISKVARHHVLVSFNKIFDYLSRLACDPDPDVKNGAETLDRLIKDIVTDFPKFDVPRFVPLLSERINARDPHVRRFLVSWIKTLEELPDLDFLTPLPQYLGGLFKILDDQHEEIRELCLDVLGSFLNEIKDTELPLDFASMINTLASFSASSDTLTKETAISWLPAFVQIAKLKMLPFLATLLRAVLPTLCRAHDSRLVTLAMTANQELLRLVREASDEDLAVLDLSPLLRVLMQQFADRTDSTSARLASLRWLLMLRRKLPTRMYANNNEILEPLLDSLSTQDPNVVVLALELLAEISLIEEEQPEVCPPDAIPFYSKFMKAIVSLFRVNREFLSSKVRLVVNHLSKYTSPAKVFSVFADILLEPFEGQSDAEFKPLLVQHLNIILLTSTDVSTLRSMLRNLSSSEAVQLFVKLYKSWCFDAVATLSLCLLCQVYDHAAELVVTFGRLEVTTGFLVELDKLIKLIESPIFTNLRLQLLSPIAYAHLIKCLYGISMLLPQSTAYHTLKSRLDCIPAIVTTVSRLEEDQELKGNINLDVPFADLLKHFLEIQQPVVSE
eukprot:m.36847 g.36847  ORF g.36847 m.36847 type:complete len:675 (+) comp10037_c1_seq2:140-2164(+)